LRMSPKDPDTHTFVEHRSRRMMSFAIYHKLKSLSDGWNREERGKAKVAAGAIVGLLVLFSLIVVGVRVLARDAIFLVPIGFVAWLVLIVVLIRKYLGAKRTDS